MKFNRDIFLTAPLWANWATVDRWGHIWVWEFEPQLSECGTYWTNLDSVCLGIRVGRTDTLGLNLMPRRIKKP